MPLEKETMECFQKCRKSIERLKDVLSKIDLQKLKNLAPIARRKTDQETSVNKKNTHIAV